MPERRQLCWQWVHSMFMHITSPWQQLSDTLLPERRHVLSSNGHMLVPSTLHSGYDVRRQHMSVELLGNTISNGLCSCVAPYFPSTKAATDCNNDTCGPNGIPTPGSALPCACAAGWTNSGSCPSGGNCVYCNARIPPCNTPGLCQNGATCFNSQDLSAFICTCTSAFTGNNCQLETDACPAQNPCQNGGTCQNSANLTSHWCNCASGWTRRSLPDLHSMFLILFILLVIIIVVVLNRRC